MATEETKPVEREAFEKWAMSQDMPVLRYGGTQFTLDYLDGATDRAWEVWQASTAAALERAAEVAREHYERCVLTTNGVACEKCKTARDIENAILALKGSR